MQQASPRLHQRDKCHDHPKGAPHVAGEQQQTALVAADPQGRTGLQLPWVLTIDPACIPPSACLLSSNTLPPDQKTLGEMRLAQLFFELVGAGAAVNQEQHAQ